MGSPASQGILLWLRTGRARGWAEQHSRWLAGLDMLATVTVPTAGKSLVQPRRRRPYLGIHQPPGSGAPTPWAASSPGLAKVHVTTHITTHIPKTGMYSTCPAPGQVHRQPRSE